MTLHSYESKISQFFPGTSAPSSPAKSRESLLQRVQSLTGAARDQGANLVSAAASAASRVQAFNKDRCFTLLVIDDQNTDWSKYFRGKRLHGELANPFNPHDLSPIKY